MCNLIARFWDVNAGKITIGGTDVRDFKLDSLMKNISMVFQSVYLFADTIENNIKFGCPDASKEMIQAYEGLFGMELQMWERIRDQDLDYADEDFGAFQEPMSVIEQEEALKLYDAGADIYLITNFSSPIYVMERMEIERGPEHYQMSMAERERFRNLEWGMQKYPQIQSFGCSFIHKCA